MRDSRRLLIVPAAALLFHWCASIPTAGAQAPAARFAFADTTLLRDTLNLSFAGLFPMADSLRVTPDSLRAWSVRYELPIYRIAFLADSLNMPADSVGPVLLREQFNPLARSASAATTTSFQYSTTYGTSKQSSSWGNNVTYDVQRGPALLHNVTSVRIDRYHNTLGTSRYRANTTTTELGWKVSPEAALGLRLNLQRVAARVTNEYQGSLRARRDFGRQRTVTFNAFGGAYDQPRDNVTRASKKGIGTNAETRIEYAPTEQWSFTLNGNGSVRAARTALPRRREFNTRDLTWASDGTFTYAPRPFATLRLTGTANHSRIQQPTTFGPRTALQDGLVDEPSGGVNLQAGLQLSSRYGTVQVNTTTGRTTSLTHSEDTTGVHLNSQVHRERGVQVDGQTQLAGWSLDGHLNVSSPDDESSRPSVLNVGTQAVTAYFRERGTTGTRSLTSTLTRRLTRTLTMRARGDIGVTRYRYALTDTSQLAGQTRAVARSTDYDNYHQSLRMETSLAPSSDKSTTVALELGHTATVRLTPETSADNAEDRTYRAEWIWTYRLLRDLTVNQNTQLTARYDRIVFAPTRNRLSMDYRTITTLSARVTPRLAIDMTHSATYGPRGAYITAAAGGGDVFVLSDASRDYLLQGRIGYTPIPAFTLNFTPQYHAFYDEDRSRGGARRRNGWRQLTVGAGASVNIGVGRSGRLSGSISQNLDRRRDIVYTNGVEASYRQSITPAYWNGQLQFTWSPQ